MGEDGSEDPNGTAADRNALARGAALYDQQCAVCHGQQGQGGTAPALRGFPRGLDTLTSIIDERMPQGQPDRCKGACASEVAKYILAGFPAANPVCGDGDAFARRLRLLSRREYQNTIRTLFGWDDTGCRAPEFRYRPMGSTPKTVHLAGSMNGWPGTLAAGGWPLAYDAGSGVWTLRRAMDVGSYQYKFVLDEKDWIADPENPSSIPDGFGGKNSLLTVACKPKGPPAPSTDVTANFPPDARPDGFPFDDSADARLVTPVHAEEYRRAAQTLAQTVTSDLKSVVSCDPSGGKAAACALDFVRSFGQRVFRRPLTAAEQTRYQTLILSVPSFDTGVTLAISALLQSPHFLYRSELGEPQPDGTFRLTGYEVASALSYLFWGTMPDAALFDAAARGDLGSDSGIEAQARRMLSDPRTRDTLGLFAQQWLGIERVRTIDKRLDQFPSWNDPLRQALLDETARFFAHVAFESSGQLRELFTADYTFMNEPLARLYGVSGISGTALQKVPYSRATGTPRAGILGHGSVLASYAHSDQTSPIRRGLFVRRSLLCQELPNPPPNAGGVPAVDANATTRERFRQHTQNAFCKGCHQFIDDVGFGFERFDPIGAPRDSERGMPIDSTGDMNDLEGLGGNQHAPYSSLPELAGRLATADSAQSCFVRQYLRFARGQGEDVAVDLCTLSRLRQTFRQQDGRIPELMIALVKLREFVNRR